jgi:hypothetical protein
MADNPEPVALAASPSVVATAPTSSSSATFVGWVSLPVNETAPAKVAVEESSLDSVYLAVFSEGFDGVTIADSASDFGDIATCRSTDDQDDALAEDAVFELIGAGEF